MFMPHQVAERVEVHLLVRPHPKMNGPKLMQMFKKNTGHAIMKLLGEADQRQFDQQRGLNGNTFWKYSFRSIVIDREGMLSQKIQYIHQNPVNAGYVERAEDYRWSSARLLMSGLMDEQTGLAYNEVVNSLGIWAVEGEGGPYKCPEA
jgi:REP element-mobilizing transposase RayT